MTEGPVSTQRLLLVDDEAHIRSVLRRILARRFPQLEVTEASSAEEALSLARGGGRFDVVLTDYRMEGATGGDLLRALASEAPGTARVLATGYQDDSMIQEGIAGVPLDGRLAKPWDNDELVTLIGALLSRRAAGEKGNGKEA